MISARIILTVPKATLRSLSSISRCHLHHSAAGRSLRISSCPCPLVFRTKLYLTTAAAPPSALKNLTPRLFHQSAITMATSDDAAAAQHQKKEFPAPPSLESLQDRLQYLSIQDPLPVFPSSNPTSNPVDIYRCYIAHQLVPITGVDIEFVYPALEWTQTFDKGDLIVAVPRLRVKGRKPNELAKEWADKVGSRFKIR
jgi:hypothetical protein